MELFASVKNGKGEIVEITSNDFSTKKDFKSYLHSEGFKVRFISKDTIADIALTYEKYEEKKATAKAKRKAKTEQVENAEPVGEPVSEPISEVENAEPVSEPISEVENAEPVGEPVSEPISEVENAEPVSEPISEVEKEFLTISAYKLNNIYDLIEHLEHFLTKRELVATISNKFNISNKLAVELYNRHIKDMYLDDIE